MWNKYLVILLVLMILGGIITVAVAMRIYNSAQDTITDSLHEVSTQEIEAFNNIFESYKGNQTGSQVSVLIGRLIANSDTFQNEPDHVLNVYYSGNNSGSEESITVKYDTVDAELLEEYKEALSEIENKLKNRSTYKISFDYEYTGLISVVRIEYDGNPNNPNDNENAITNENVNAITNTAESTRIRRNVNDNRNTVTTENIVTSENTINENPYNTESNLNSMSVLEIETFNNSFEGYKGKQTGSQVSELIRALISSSYTYQNEPEKVPSVRCSKINQNMIGNAMATYNMADTKLHQNYMDGLISIKDNVENDHVYTVSFEYTSVGTISLVNIEYDDTSANTSLY